MERRQRNFTHPLSPFFFQPLLLPYLFLKRKEGREGGKKEGREKGREGERKKGREEGRGIKEGGEGRGGKKVQDVSRSN